MRNALASLAFALAAIAPAQAEVVEQADNGFVVQHSLTVSTDPDATFAMLRTPAKWWDKDHTWTGNAENLYMDAQAGGCFCELIPNEATTESGAPQRTLRGSVQHMQITYVDPGRLLRMSGALGPLQSEALAGAMTFTLKPVKGGTRITMDYVVGGFMRMKTADIAPAVDKVLVAQLSRLAMALGPLVGAGDAADTADEKPEDPVPATGDEPASDSAVSALVSDLAPDDAVTDSSTDLGDPEPELKPEAKPAPKPAPKPTSKPAAASVPAAKSGKPATRPVTRPARDENESESGR
ncbi:SRPBCC family protein [Blastomonas sp. SL216]|uniref:SRPBCC family protein n=1 Tax=Blastomonas sp. SL216 TaxID=2995169 RepID=UPI0023772E7C|nr:hypothetical protein OU999_01630 [Blastomonas sp. SL216]